jgi:murein DD-endopeptidase MepM/ murein hydrolase activator NlpD
MKIALLLFIMIETLFATSLGVVAGVRLDLPLPKIGIEEFIDRSIGYVPEAIVEDGLPFFGSKRGDFKQKNREHKGYDIYINHIDVIASATGYVKELAHGKLSGTYIKLAHKNGVETLYIHLTSVSVKKGDSVKKGELLGRIDGPAGNAIAPQLHYEIKVDGIHKNPLFYIKENYHDNRILLKKITDYERMMQELVSKRDGLVREYLKSH